MARRSNAAGIGPVKRERLVFENGRLVPSSRITRAGFLLLIGAAVALVTSGSGAPAAAAPQDTGSGPPEIDRLDREPKVAEEGDWVDFIAQASDPDGRVLRYRWDFGDGEAAEDDSAVDVASITHRYRDDGTYLASLRIDADDGESATERFPVYVVNVAPEIRDVSRTGAAVEGSTITFSVGAIDPGPDDELSYTWHFGDGGTGEGQNPEHSYDKDGSYRVTVEVDDGDGGKASHTIVVIVGSGYEYNLTGDVEASEDGPMAGVMGIRGETLASEGGRPGYCYVRFYFETSTAGGTDPDVGIHLSAVVRGGLSERTYAVGAVKTVPNLFYVSPDPWEDQNRSPQKIFGWVDTQRRFDHGDGRPDSFVSQGGALSIEYFDGKRVEGSFDLGLVELGPEFAGRDNQRPLRHASLSGRFAHELSRDGFGARSVDIYECIEDETFAVDTHFPDRNDQNIDPEDPELEVAFTAPYDPETLNEDTFRVEYRLAGGEYERLDGFLERVDDETVRFTPTYDLLDGVLYCVRVKAGEEGVRGLDGEVLEVPPPPTDIEEIAYWRRVTGGLQPGTRTVRACIAGGRPFEEAYEWGFATTVEIEHLRADVYQVQKDVKLVPGKHTTTLVYVRWSEKQDVHPDVQVKRFEADVFVEADGRRVYTPKNRTVVTRRDQFTDADVALLLATVNFHGWKPTKRSGTSTIEATVRPSDQNRKPPREFESKAPKTIEHWDLSPTLTFDYYLLPLFRWSEGIPAAEMAQVHRLVQEGAQFTTQNFPFVSTRARYRGVADVSGPWLGPFENKHGDFKVPLSFRSGNVLDDVLTGFVTGQEVSQVLGWELLRAVGNTTADAIVGIVPRDPAVDSWNGVMAAYYNASKHFSLVLGGKRVILLRYDEFEGMRPRTLGHEFGHFFGLCHTTEKAEATNACYPYATTHQGMRILPGGRQARVKADGYNGEAPDLKLLTSLLYPYSKPTWQAFISFGQYRDRLFENLERVFGSSSQIAMAPSMPEWMGAGLAMAPRPPVALRPPQDAGASTSTNIPEEPVLSVSGLLAADGSGALIRRVRPASDSTVAESLGGFGDSGTVSPPVEYTLELRGRDGSALASTAVTPLQARVTDTEPVEGAAMFFEARLPDREEAGEIALLGNGRVLARQERTPSAPTVTELDIRPAGDGKYRAAWTATDADGDALSFDVYYSPTAGSQARFAEGAPESDWRPMAVGTTRKSLDFSAANVERGPSPAMRVVASDGFNVGELVATLDVELPLTPLTTMPGAGGRLDPQGRISAFFSTELAEGAASLESMTLLDEDGEPVVADVSWDAGTWELILTPLGPLDPGEEYTATLRAGLRDQTGGALPADITWRFSTTGEREESDTEPAPEASVVDAVEPAPPAPVASASPAPAWDAPTYLTGEQAGSLGRDGVRFLWAEVSGDLKEEFAGNQNAGSALAQVTCEGDYGMKLELFDAPTLREAKRSVTLSLGEPLKAPGSYQAWAEYMQTANLFEVYSGAVDFEVLALESPGSPGGPRLIVEVRGEGLRTDGGKTASLHLRLDLNTTCEE